MMKAVAWLIVFTAWFAPRSLAQTETEEVDPKLTVRSVVPADTDKRIDKFSGGEWQHWVYLNPNVPDKKLLLVFLPGTGGKPSGGHPVCTLAANEGFRAIMLAYPDTLSISHFHGSADPDAFQKARENILYGTTPFEGLDTGVPNSIQNRLHFLLHYLVDHFPQENWQQFFHKGGRNFDYGRMIFAGSSQGGGHAALIAYEHPVARVLMFGAPKDFNVHFNQPAKWYGNTSATPLDRFFSFVHSKDEGHGCTYAQQLENYRAMKLTPRYPIVNVDTAAPPYNHSRLLTSERPSNFPHGAPSKNKVYRDTWKYLLEEPVE